MIGIHCIRKPARVLPTERVLTEGSRILFNATATGMYPPERCQGSEGQARGSEAACQVPLGESGLNLTISNKEWTSTTGVMKKGPLLPWI